MPKRGELLRDTLHWQWAGYVRCSFHCAMDVPSQIPHGSVLRLCKMSHFSILFGEISLNCSFLPMVCSCGEISLLFSFGFPHFLHFFPLEPSSRFHFLAPRVPSASVSSRNGKSISLGVTLATVTFGSDVFVLPFTALAVILLLPLPLPFPLHVSACVFATFTNHSPCSSGVVFTVPPA